MKLTTIRTETTKKGTMKPKNETQSLYDFVKKVNLNQVYKIKITARSTKHPRLLLQLY